MNIQSDWACPGFPDFTGQKTGKAAELIYFLGINFQYLSIQQ